MCSSKTLPRSIKQNIKINALHTLDTIDGAVFEFVDRVRSECARRLKSRVILRRNLESKKPYRATIRKSYLYREDSNHVFGISYLVFVFFRRLYQPREARAAVKFDAIPPWFCALVLLSRPTTRTIFKSCRRRPVIRLSRPS